MFKASAFKFRFRYALHTVIYVLGFFAPWNYFWHVDEPGANAHMWGLIASNLGAVGVSNVLEGFNVALVFAIVCAAGGAWLRTWGAAYLGAKVVQSGAMHTAQAVQTKGIMQDGPFRFVRNPLYIGTFLHTLALALLMPPSGAIFCVVAIAVLQERLILAEEPFLTDKLGPAYVAYCALVPRLLPTLRPRVAVSGLKPRWPQAILGEIYFWGVAGSFAVAGWRYSEVLLLRCVLVSFGVALLARAIPTPE